MGAPIHKTEICLQRVPLGTCDHLLPQRAPSTTIILSAARMSDWPCRICSEHILCSQSSRRGTFQIAHQSALL